MQFREKKFNIEGSINGGIYLCKKQLLDKVKEEKFSFEKEIMEKFVAEKYFSSFESKAYFMDIGIPEDYRQFKVDFGNE